MAAKAKPSSSTVSPRRVCIVGGGIWGSAMAKILGNNVIKLDGFDNRVDWYVHDYDINGRKLTEIINTDHENVRDLPGYKLRPTVVANPDVVEATKKADVLVFVLPREVLKRTCIKLKKTIKQSAVSISLIKGLEKEEDGGLVLISDVIERWCGSPCCVLMGANSPTEIAAGTFVEGTIGSANLSHGKMFKELFQTDSFRLRYVRDFETVEICGALKEVVGLAADIISCIGLRTGEPERAEYAIKENSELSLSWELPEGMGYGENTKAAVIRLGLMEMVSFVEEFYPSFGKMRTFFESCGIPDLIATCYGGRNAALSQIFVLTNWSVGDLENDLTNEQTLPGPPIAAEVNFVLKARNLEQKFPLFTAVHKICRGEIPPTDLIKMLENHPVHQ